MECGGSDFCPERSPFTREIEADWHFRQAGYRHRHHHCLDHHHNIHSSSSRMFMEKLEPGSSSDLCRCYTCSSTSMVHRLPARPPPHTIFPDGGPEWRHQVKEFGLPCPENSSPFSIRTPVRKDSPALLQNDSPCNSMPPRMCVGYSPQNFMSFDRHQACLKPAENQINLHRWFLIKLKEDNTTVALGGLVKCGYDMELVTTGPIADRIEKGRLRTRDGTEVRLMGFIDEEATIANGFSASLSRTFYTGFPCTWKNIVQDCCLLENLENVSTPVAEKKLESCPEGICPETPVSSIPGAPEPVAETRGGVAATEMIHSGEPALDSAPGEKENPDESAAEEQVETQQEQAAAAAHGDGDTPAVVKRSQTRKRAMRLPTRSSKRLNKGKEKENQESDGSNESSRGKRVDSSPEKGDDSFREKPQNEDLETKCEEEIVREKLSFPLKPPEPAVAAVATAAEQELAGEQQQHYQQQEHQETQVEEDFVVEVEVPASEDVQQARGLSRKRSRRMISRGSRKRNAPARKLVEVVDAADEGEGARNSENDGENKPGATRKASEPPQEETPEPENTPETKKDPAEETGKASMAEKEIELEVEVEVVKVDHREVVEDEPDEKRVISKRRSSRRKTTKATTRSRKRKQKVASAEEKQRSLPVVQVDGDDDQPETKPEKQLSSRTKRSALPPPLPASRVAKSEVIEAYGLKTSRSGRLLVPPLAYWRNQTLALDKDGGIIAIMDGFAEPPSDTGIFNFKPPSEKKRLQEKLCAAAQDSGKPSDKKGKKKIRGSK